VNDSSNGTEARGRKHQQSQVPPPDPRQGPRGWIIFLVAIGILISQTVVASLGHQPSELMVGTAIILLGIPVATSLDEKRRR